VNPLLELLGDAGHILDTPGAYLRGAMAGRPGERASGQEMLGDWGIDGGFAGGLAADIALDPLNLLGGAGAIKGGQALARRMGGGGRLASRLDDFRLDERLAGLGPGRSLPESMAMPPPELTREMVGLPGPGPNPLAERMREFGADEYGALRPFMEIGRRSDPDFVNAKTWYHGTATPGLTPENLDIMKTDPNGLFGRGLYMSDEGHFFDPATAPANPTVDDMITGGYANARHEGSLAQWQRENSPSLAFSRWADSGDPAERAGAVSASFRQHGLGDLLESRRAAAEQMGGGPWEVESAHRLISRLERMGNDPATFERVRAALGDLGLHQGPMPSARPRVYEAGTDFGKILDLDLPVGSNPGFRDWSGDMMGMADRRHLDDIADLESLIEAKWRESEHYVPYMPDGTPVRGGIDPIVELEDMTQALEFNRSQPLPSRQLGELLGGGDTPTSEVFNELMGVFRHPGRMDEDLLIRLLREGGYDAMTHTGGLRWGGGRDLHQTLIGLDPNDTISKVGRTGQVPRFDEFDPAEALQRILSRRG
jgi:hypothetical protein